MAKYLKFEVIHPLSWMSLGGIMQSKPLPIETFAAFSLEIIINKYPSGYSTGYLYGNRTSDFSVYLRGNNLGPVASFKTAGNTIIDIPISTPCTQFAVTFSSGTARVYGDGKLCGMKSGILSKLKLDGAIGSGLLSRGVVINRIRLFKNLLDAASIHGFFNGGRYWEAIVSDNQRAGLISEYLPESLSPRKWLDTGSLKMDLVAISPNRTEVNCKDFVTPVIISDTPPYKAPAFIGQKWIDTTTKVAYQANNLGKTNWLILTQ